MTSTRRPSRERSSGWPGSASGGVPERRRLVYSAVNWVTDLACLAVCVSALGVPVPWTHLVIVYGATLGAASLSFTPAGIGIVESTIAVALVQSGVPTSAAIVAALLYRAVSCWLALGVGWVSYAMMRRGNGVGEPAPRREPTRRSQVADCDPTERSSIFMTTGTPVSQGASPCRLIVEADEFDDDGAVTATVGLAGMPSRLMAIDGRHPRSGSHRAPGTPRRSDARPRSSIRSFR